MDILLILIELLHIVACAEMEIQIINQTPVFLAIGPFF